LATKLKNTTTENMTGVSPAVKSGEKRSHSLKYHKGLKCCVVDERSEIAACVQGQPQNDLGSRCDVLDACPKLLGMKMVLRSMSPEVIAVDELGKKEEFAMFQEIATSGVKVLGTIHAGTIKEVLQHPYLPKGTIERFVELRKKKNGKREYFIYDKEGSLMQETSHI